MQNRRGLLFLGLALLLGVVAAGVAQRWMTTHAIKAPEAVETANVVVARVDLSVASSLSDRQLQTVEWPSAHVPDGAFSNVNALNGRIVRRPLAAGEPVMESALFEVGAEGGLAAVIEAGDDPGSLLDEFLQPIIEAKADVVVLGCTHYPIIRDEIAARLPDGVELVDPAPAVARRALDVAHSVDIDLRSSAATLWWSTQASVADDGTADIEPFWEPIDIPEGALASIRVGRTTLSAMAGDLTTMEVDAIVNAANTELAHGGGIALAISRAGGPIIDAESAEWIQTYGPLAIGVAALTSAGEMPASYVIHTAGPIYAEGQDNETLLAAAALAAVDVASEIDVRTIALPAVSAGIYGYPPDEATGVLVDSVAEFVGTSDTSVLSVRFVGYDDAMAERFAVAIDALVAGS
jgi:O-acetyl-ADP-ribose deacetylase (regulator of RNase III)